MSGTPVTIAETQEKIHRSKTKLLDGQAGYLEEKIVGSEYINIVEDDGAVGKCLKVELDASAVITGVLDGKVKVDTSDVREFLENKITAGTGISITKKTVSGKKNLEIAGAYTAGAGIVITGASIASTALAHETVFTGSATKVPTSKAIGDVLKALVITDATDVGISGDAIMYKTKSINLLSMPIGETSYVDADIFTGHFPNAISDVDIISNQGLSFSERSRNTIMISSQETATQQAGDGYAYLFGNIMIDEDWDAFNGDGLTLSLIVSNTDGIPEETAEQVKARVQYDILDTNDVVVNSSSSIQDITWALTNDTNVKEVKFPLTITTLTAGKPLALSFQISLASDLYTPVMASHTMKNEINIHAARVLVATKTINLRIADVDI